MSSLAKFGTNPTTSCAVRTSWVILTPISHLECINLQPTAVVFATRHTEVLETTTKVALEEMEQTTSITWPGEL